MTRARRHLAVGTQCSDASGHRWSNGYRAREKASQLTGFAPAKPKSYCGGVVLTEWDDIGAVLSAVFISILAILFLVVYLEKWLARPSPTEPGEPWRRHWVIRGASILRRSRHAMSRVFR